MALTLRSYQEQIVEQVQCENAIVKMPTGSGKTFVASEIIKRHFSRNPSTKALFLVPTVDLVDQQATAVETWFGSTTMERVARYHGGLSVPQIAVHRVMVSTPSAFLALQTRDSKFSWKGFGICIFDEVHHVLKDHPYRKIAFRLNGFLTANAGAVQIVGLSASLTYAVTANQIKAALDSLFYDLRITKLCSPSQEELMAGGYKPQQGEVELIDARETPDGVVPEYAREPHRMYETFMKRVQRREATEFTLLVWDTVKLLEEHASTLVPFESPLKKAKLSSWEDCASKLQKTKPHFRSLFLQLESWYVGLKLLVVTWEEEEPLMMQWLTSSGAFEIRPEFSLPLRSKIEQLQQLASNSLNFTKLAALCGQLLEKKERFGESFRCIVFVQQRICAHIVAHAINTTERLKNVGLVASYVTGQGKITPSISMSASQAKDGLDRFRKGTVDVLVATATAEEGLDVPAANVVISYNHMKDSVELCQREGRARQADCAFVVMEQRRDRHIGTLRNVQRNQETIIRNFDPKSAEETRQKNLTAESQRQVGANRWFLLQQCDNDSNYLQVMNMYRQKTKAHLDESWSMTASDGKHCVTLVYSNMCLSIDAEGRGLSKKVARQSAAQTLVVKLKQLMMASPH